MDKMDILKGLFNEGFYDFIANNYYKLSKEQLKDVLLELAFASYEYDRAGYDGIEKSAIYELSERL